MILIDGGLSKEIEASREIGIIFKRLELF